MIVGVDGLILHEADHRYEKDRRLISVTDSLRAEGLIELDWVTEHARWRGSVAHRGCHLINKRTLNWDTVHPEIEGYLDSYEAFLPISGFTIVGYETPIWHPRLFYAGMPDLFGLLNGHWTVIDYKTGAVQAWAAFQTALYVLALIEHPSLFAGYPPPPKSPYLWKRFGLRLWPDGRLPKLEPFTDVNDFGLAQHIVSMGNWKINHGYDLWRVKTNE